MELTLKTRETGGEAQQARETKARQTDTLVSDR